MPPIASSFPGSVTSSGPRWNASTWTDRVNILRHGLDEITSSFNNAESFTVLLPPGITLPWAPYISQLVLTGADVLEVGPSLFNLPPDAPAQFRSLADETRRMGELRVWLMEELVKVDALYNTRKAQMCQVAGVVVAQVKGLDGTVLLSQEQRTLVNQVKGPIYQILNDNNAGIQQTRQHNQHLVAHAELQVASVRADLAAAQAENQVLRGQPLDKAALAAPAATAPGHKKAGGKKRHGKKPARPGKKGPGKGL